VKTIMYSSNNEEFNCDSADDLIDNYDMVLGQKYWSCEFETMNIPKIAAQEAMSRLDDYLDEELGDCYDRECVYIGKEAEKELEDFFELFLKKYTSLLQGGYMQRCGKSTEHIVTAEDLIK